MANKLLFVRVRGTCAIWEFPFYGDPKDIPIWEADGLEVVEIQNMVPGWVADLKLTGLWNKLQNLFNFKNPWGK